MKQLKESILDQGFDADDMVVDVPKFKNPKIFHKVIVDVNSFNHCAFLNLALSDVKNAIQKFIDNCKEYGFRPDGFGINRSPIENHINNGKLEADHFKPATPAFTEKELKQFIKNIVDLDGLFAKHIPNYTRMTRDEIYCRVGVIEFIDDRKTRVMFDMDNAKEIVNKLDGLKVGKMTLKKTAPQTLEIYF